jgi:hypothetical protein
MTEWAGGEVGLWQPITDSESQLQGQRVANDIENTGVISEKDEENNKEDAHAVALNVVLGVVQLKMRMEMNRKIEEEAELFH